MTLFGLSNAPKRQEDDDPFLVARAAGMFLEEVLGDSDDGAGSSEFAEPPGGFLKQDNQ